MNEFSPSTDDADAAVLKRCFAPVVDAHTRILVLGSLPGERSLAQQQYYGNRQNRFWTLMSGITAVDLVALDYEARLRALLAHGIGLWDVVAQARREGSLDSQIRGHVGNDLVGLVESLAQLRTIAFNGGTAARLGMKALGEHARRYRIVPLPSSSPAYTAPYAEKLLVWKTLGEDLAC
ncbi:DNA-deoxyinosine glycosylase [Massilia violaceinigra]|uniref:DNA-deoxyinosine glycosylase n=1 Tax=Massilia violaceinigra TaxID=2045208 RepID=A0A2D2DJG4_9BURK|nr:DNA-deoxyinosine glycosylase [Massilia violaceinigra]ATQ75123.1 DNA-deoxyinosine glycosylase [Massilia violaceinigra]